MLWSLSKCITTTGYKYSELSTWTFGLYQIEVQDIQGCVIKCWWVLPRWAFWEVGCATISRRLRSMQGIQGSTRHQLKCIKAWLPEHVIFDKFVLSLDLPKLSLHSSESLLLLHHEHRHHPRGCAAGRRLFLWSCTNRSKSATKCWISHCLSVQRSTSWLHQRQI